ncbi:CYTH and CHAD domain-containing protein [Roseomonas elaeocarpi]|uniref:CHAD domain-containing protein n=1 Tax=Roseomonas elaeocarpi TaxID=907779 RepID=A0ABV6JNU3_9PROT
MTEASSTDNPTELEIKLVLPDAAFGTLVASPLLAAGASGPPRTQRLVATYYDTPEHHLLRAGMALRLRVRSNGARRRSAPAEQIQTLKTQSDGSAFGRGEWEWPVSGDAPDLSLLRDTPAAGLLPEGATLAPVFRTEVEREVRRLQLDGAMVELALDRGVLRAGEQAELLREVEMELESGSATALYRLAAALHAEVPAAVMTGESKAARGWRLALGHPAKPVKADDLAFDEAVSAEAGFRAVVASGLRHLLANLPAARAGEVEGIHQMRVAIRRLRAALRLFRPVLAPEAERGFEAELRRLGQVLGAARDWDVFCTETLPEAAAQLEEAAPAGAAPTTEAGAPGQGWIAMLRVPAERERAAAQEAVAAELAGPALTALSLGLAGWAEEGAVLAGPGVEPGEPLRDLVPDLLEPLERVVMRRGKRIRRRSIEDLHRLRKALKRLRYGVEFLESLLPAKRTKHYLSGCRDIQEGLGHLNDAASAIETSRKLTAAAGHAELMPALAALEGWAVRRRDEALKGLPGEWKSFRKLRAPF